MLTETRPQTGASEYTQRLIELATTQTEPYHVRAYFPLLSELGTPEALNFLITQAYAPLTETRNEAGMALATFATDLVVIPLSRRVTPQVTADLNPDITRLSAIPSPNRAQFLAEVIPAGVERYYKARRGEQTPERSGTQILAKLMVRRSMIAATELPEGQETFFDPAAQVLSSNLLDRDEMIQTRGFLASGQDAAIPTILKLFSEHSLKEWVTTILMDINSELSLGELKIRLPGLEASYVDINRLVQIPDPVFRKKVMELLSPAPKTSYKLVYASHHDISPTISTLTAETPLDKQMQLIPLLALQATSHNRETASAAVNALLNLGTSEAWDAAYEITCRNWVGLDSFIELARQSRSDARDRVLQLFEASEYGSKMGQTIAEELTQFNPELLSASVEAMLRRTFQNSHKVPFKVAGLAAKLKLDGVLPTLYILLEDDQDRTTADTIAKYGTPEVAHHLLNRLANAKTDKVRANAALGLQNVPFDSLDEGANAEQAQRLQRLTAGKLQTSYLQQVISGLLISAFGDPSEEVRRYAISTLGEIGDAEVAKALWEKFRDQDKSVGYNAALAIKKIKQRLKGQKD